MSSCHLPERGLLCAPSLDIHVSLPIISFCPQDDSEDKESSDDKEEAEEEEGRTKGFHASRVPLAVISHVKSFQGCVSVILCLYGREDCRSILGGQNVPT